MKKILIAVVAILLNINLIEATTHSITCKSGKPGNIDCKAQCATAGSTWSGNAIYVNPPAVTAARTKKGIFCICDSGSRILARATSPWPGRCNSVTEGDLSVLSLRSQKATKVPLGKAYIEKTDKTVDYNKVASCEVEETQQKDEE